MKKKQRQLKPVYFEIDGRITFKKTDVRLIRIKELKEAYGIHYDKETIPRWSRTGRFPKRVKINPGCVGWRSDEVDAWMTSNSRSKP